MCEVTILCLYGVKIFCKLSIFTTRSQCASPLKTARLCNDFNRVLIYFIDFIMKRD